MSPNNVTIGIDLLVSLPTERAPGLLTPRFARGFALSALPRSVGDRKHSACVLSAGGEILAETEITNTRECLTVFAQRYPGATFVMETGTHSPWVSRLLEALGHIVHVGNARKLRAICSLLCPRKRGHPIASPSAMLRATLNSVTPFALPRSVRQPHQERCRGRPHALPAPSGVWSTAAGAGCSTVA